MTATLFLVAETVVGQAIEPLIYGHSTGLSPVAVCFLTGPEAVDGRFRHRGGWTEKFSAMTRGSAGGKRRET